ncbi:MAG: hypothetical protein EI684_06925 [Candidatus Viridilinea halotolerans]|uniref:Glycosyltransferase RgtA/B/C/D-like domain-containing protein n=1 Tax=Candidatus Viridilinea halotolerans TaxID=2491704 RepID=A0A426U3P7_9CHLR|nr:MAG: hypothetical protein EI684_06925 [Candidatus Viridilinea halotolerans]
MTNIKTHLAALGLYLIVALWLTWPLMTDLTNIIYVNRGGPYFFPGTEDAIQNSWNMWWLGYAVRNGLNPFVTPLLYYPEGVPLYLQTVNFTTIFSVLPVTLLVGPDEAYNVAVLLAYQLTGYAGFVLARRYVDGFAPSFLAGLLLTATPHHVGKFDVGQLNFVTTQWLFLAMAALVLLGQRGSPWRLVAAALALVLTVLTDWYLAVVIAFFACGWALLSSLRAQRPWQSLAWFAGAGLLSGLLLSPLFYAIVNLPKFTGRMDEGQLEVWAAVTQGNSMDGMGLFFPAALHPWWGEAVGRVLMPMAPYSIMEGSYHAPGWLFLTLGCLGIYWYGWREWPWLIMLGVAWLFAVGPTLYLLGYNTGIPMAYRLIQFLPLIETARRPGLFILIGHAALLVFAALALQRLATTLAPRKRTYLWGGVVALAIIELTPGLRQAIPIETAPVFAQIRTERPGVVVDLPVEIFPESRTLFHQIVHQQPIFAGYVARVPPSYDTLAYAPLAHALGRMRPWAEHDIVPLDRASWQAQQCFYRLRHVVLEERLITPEERSVVMGNMERLVGAAPTPWYQQDGFTAYELPLYADQCRPFVYLGPEWHSLEEEAGDLWRWTNGASAIYLVNPGDTPRSVVLHIQATAPEARHLDIWHTQQQTAATVKLTRANREYHVVLQVEPGTNRFELRSATNGEEGTERRLGIVVQRLEVVW